MKLYSVTQIEGVRYLAISDDEYEIARDRGPDAISEIEAAAEIDSDGRLYWVHPLASRDSARGREFLRRELRDIHHGARRAPERGRQ